MRKIRFGCYVDSNEADPKGQYDEVYSSSRVYEMADQAAEGMNSSFIVVGTPG